MIPCDAAITKCDASMIYRTDQGERMESKGKRGESIYLKPK
jgi:hypothetical protein